MNTDYKNIKTILDAYKAIGQLPQHRDIIEIVTVLNKALNGPNYQLDFGKKDKQPTWFVWFVLNEYGILESISKKHPKGVGFSKCARVCFKSKSRAMHACTQFRETYIAFVFSDKLT